MFRADGARLHVVLAAPVAGVRRISAPMWSPDARRIYFVGGTKEVHGKNFVYEESDVFFVPLGTRGEPRPGGLRRITRLHDVQAVVPSPNGKGLVIARMEHPGSFPAKLSLWLVDTEGGELRSLVEGENGRIDVPGSWSPDGHVLAITRCKFAYPDKNGFTPNTCAVYTVSYDGSDLRKLVERSSSPAFSPDGQRISFVSDRDENGTFMTGSDEEDFANELYVMNADGSDVRRLTSSSGLNEDRPAWSPDGSRIAFSREGPASFTDQVMAVNPDGTCAAVVIGDATKDGVDAASFNDPAWRPGALTHGMQPRACPRG